MKKYSCTSNQVTVTVAPKYERVRSKPEQSLYVFSYSVVIQNGREDAIQINRRSWIITDALANVEYVEGEGVVGEQPIIVPGKNFSYTSFCPLKTTFGSMRGHFYALTSTGETLKIEIPEFILAHPFSIQ